MKKKLYIVLLIINILCLLISGNYYIGLKLSHKYGTLGIITNEQITEQKRTVQFDNYISEQKGKERIILGLIILQLISLIFLIKQIKNTTMRKGPPSFGICILSLEGNNVQRS